MFSYVATHKVKVAVHSNRFCTVLHVFAIKHFCTKIFIRLVINMVQTVHLVVR